MPSSETRTESQRSLNGRYVAATLILLILGVEGAFYHLGGWNQYARVSAAVAFVEPGTPYTGTFRIDGLKDDGARLATGDWALARSGFYSNKAPGVSFLAVVPYFLLYHAERLAGLDPKTGQLTHINVWALNLWISVILEHRGGAGACCGSCRVSACTPAKARRSWRWSTRAPRWCSRFRARRGGTRRRPPSSRLARWTWRRVLARAARSAASGWAWRC